MENPELNFNEFAEVVSTTQDTALRDCEIPESAIKSMVLAMRGNGIPLDDYTGNALAIGFWAGYAIGKHGLDRDTERSNN